MGLSREKAAQLYEVSKRTDGPKKWYMTQDGVKHSGLPKAHEIMRFEGKAGSIRRSRKGRTYRMADGRRYIQKNAPSMDNVVIAYKP